MSRVKFNVNTEYAYLQNFKILQSICMNLAEQLAVSNQVQAVSQNTRLTVPFLWKPLSSVKCRITLNSFSGRNATGINTSPEATTTPSPAEKPQEHPHPPPLLRRRHAHPASALAQRGEALHPQQLPEPRDLVDQAPAARRWSTRTIS